MALSESDVVTYIKNLRLFELKPLIETLERELGVSAQPVVPPPPPPPVVSPEEILYQVLLVEVGPNRIEVIRTLKELLSLELRAARDLADSAPTVVRGRIALAEAEALASALTRAGAKVERRQV